MFSCAEVRLKDADYAFAGRDIELVEGELHAITGVASHGRGAGEGA